uniref:Uncharacterized protein n=1 Tax=Aegilops tauschii subsp. strangulata TaxID=200361 RepID=A0A453B3D8_AEGTS
SVPPPVATGRAAADEVQGQAKLSLRRGLEISSFWIATVVAFNTSGAWQRRISSCVF